jgi:hypothetical protein
MGRPQKEIDNISRLASFTEYNPRPVIEVDMQGNVLYENLSSKIIFPDLKRKGMAHDYLWDFKRIAKILKAGEEEQYSREVKNKGPLV